MNARTRLLFAIPALALAVAAMPVHAQSHHGGAGYHGGGGYRGGWHGGGRGWGPGIFWGGVGLGIGIGLAPWYYPYGYAYPGYVVADAPPVVVYDSTQPPAPPPAPRSSAPDPVIYPRNGQSAQQTEADRQECNRWATTQQQAMADGSVFQRAVAACLDGRGYTVR